METCCEECIAHQRALSPWTDGWVDGWMGALYARGSGLLIRDEDDLWDGWP